MDTSSKDNLSSERIDKLVSVVERLMDRLVEVEDRLGDRGVMGTLGSLEVHIKNIEERVIKNEKDIDHRLSEVNDNVAKYVTEKLKDLEYTKNEVPNSGLVVEKAVQEEVVRKIEENKDVESRRQNIIVYRIPEKVSDSYEESKSADKQYVLDLLDAVFHIKAGEEDIDRMFLLGRLPDASNGFDGAVRPLLVRFSNSETKDQVMANVRNLSRADGRFKGVNISHDLTPNQREEIKRMIESAKKEHEEHSSEDVGNFRFLVVGQGSRQKVIKIRKQN